VRNRTASTLAETAASDASSSSASAESPDSLALVWSWLLDHLPGNNGPSTPSGDSPQTLDGSMVDQIDLLALLRYDLGYALGCFSGTEACDAAENG
jgi:hypothetical protein